MVKPENTQKIHI